MLRIELALQQAHDRQAALRRPASERPHSRRPNAARRLVGAWLVRLGRAVAGRPSSAPAWPA